MFAIRAARAVTGRSLVGDLRAGLPRDPRHGRRRRRRACRRRSGTSSSPCPGTTRTASTGRSRVARTSSPRSSIEPIQGAGGVRAASPELLRHLRAICDRTGALLIFDEVISFRAAPGGAQSLAGVRPDLTTLGKIIGGGYPAGGLRRIGGDPGPLRRPAARRPDPRRDVQRQSGRRGRRARDARRADAAGLRRPRRAGDPAPGRRRGPGRGLHGVDVRVDLAASLFQVRIGDTTAPSAVATGTGAADLFVRLLLAGFYLAPRGMGAIATPATDADVDELAAAIVAAAVRPEQRPRGRERLSRPMRTNLGAGRSRRPPRASDPRGPRDPAAGRDDDAVARLVRVGRRRGRDLDGRSRGRQSPPSRRRSANDGRHRRIGPALPRAGGDRSGRASRGRLRRGDPPDQRPLRRRGGRGRLVRAFPGRSPDPGDPDRIRAWDFADEYGPAAPSADGGSALSRRAGATSCRPAASPRRSARRPRRTCSISSS